MTQDPHLTTRRGIPAVVCNVQGMTDLNFFTPAQAHMVESVQYALVTTNMPYPSEGPKL